MSNHDLLQGGCLFGKSVMGFRQEVCSMLGHAIVTNAAT
jgi:hypothetical protein